LKVKVKKIKLDIPRDALPSEVSLKGALEDQIKKELGDIDVAKSLNANKIHSKVDFGDTFISPQLIEESNQLILVARQTQREGGRQSASIVSQ
jgi:hypothetical protein